MITAKQAGLIHAAKRELQMEDADYRALLLRVAGVESAKDLDGRGFTAVMKELRRLGFVESKTRCSVGDRDGFATQRQIDAMLEAWRRYTGAADDRALGKWLEIHFHVSHPRFMSRVAAGKAVGILLGMATKPKAKRSPKQPRRKTSSSDPKTTTTKGQA